MKPDAFPQLLLKHTFRSEKRREIREKKGDSYVKAIYIVCLFLGCFFSFLFPFFCPSFALFKEGSVDKAIFFFNLPPADFCSILQGSYRLVLDITLEIPMTFQM